MAHKGSGVGTVCINGRSVLTSVDIVYIDEGRGKIRLEGYFDNHNQSCSIEVPYTDIRRTFKEGKRSEQE